MLFCLLTTHTPNVDDKWQADKHNCQLVKGLMSRFVLLKQASPREAISSGPRSRFASDEKT